MKIKRLNHVAQNICQIFCGWRLNSSLRQIVDLGSGALNIDVLSGLCTFNGNPVEPLRIAEEVRGWLMEDLKRSGISVSYINPAFLKIDLHLSKEPWDPGSEIFYKDGREVITPEMNRCRMRCTGVITFNGKEYQRTHYADKKWPIN